MDRLAQFIADKKNTISAWISEFDTFQDNLITVHEEQTRREKYLVDREEDLSKRELEVETLREQLKQKLRKTEEVEIQLDPNNMSDYANHEDDKAYEPHPSEFDTDFKVWQYLVENKVPITFKSKFRMTSEFLSVCPKGEFYISDRWSRFSFAHTIQFELNETHKTSIVCVRLDRLKQVLEHPAASNMAANSSKLCIFTEFIKEN